MSDSETETSRVVVQTYVPAYQREEWDEHAAELGMNRSEFVRTMVQAGRKGFDGHEYIPTESETPSQDSKPPGNSPNGPPKDGQSDSKPGEDDTSDLESRVLDALSEETALTWEELLSEVTDDIETRLEETLERLQTTNRVRYSGREGGYVLAGEGT